jgi:tetratricopeptide (TPR) repeat protein
MRSTSKLLASAALAGAVLLTLTATAQPAIGTRIPVTIDVRESPAAQMRKCDQLRASIDELTDDAAKVQRVLEVIANLDVIRHAWPNATDAIVDAALTQSEVALEFNMPRNAVDALTAALPTAAKTRHDARLEYRLGAAHEVAGQFRDAEKHFLAAEDSPNFKKLDRFDADDALQTIALFYMRQNKPRESLKRFRQAAELPNQTTNGKARHRLSALKEAVRLKDDNERTEAKREAQALRDVLRLARGDSKDAGRPTDAQILSDIERDMQRVVSNAGL